VKRDELGKRGIEREGKGEEKEEGEIFQGNAVSVIRATDTY
jgi:hypothetical protein